MHVEPSNSSNTLKIVQHSFGYVTLLVTMIALAVICWQNSWGGVASVCSTKSFYILGGIGAASLLGFCITSLIKICRERAYTQGNRGRIPSPVAPRPATPPQVGPEKRDTLHPLHKTSTPPQLPSQPAVVAEPFNPLQFQIVVTPPDPQPQAPVVVVPASPVVQDPVVPPPSRQEDPTPSKVATPAVTPQSIGAQQEPKPIPQIDPVVPPPALAEVQPSSKVDSASGPLAPPAAPSAPVAPQQPIASPVVVDPKPSPETASAGTIPAAPLVTQVVQPAPPAAAEPKPSPNVDSQLPAMAPPPPQPEAVATPSEVPPPIAALPQPHQEGPTKILASQLSAIVVEADVNIKSFVVPFVDFQLDHPLPIEPRSLTSNNDREVEVPNRITTALEPEELAPKKPQEESILPLPAPLHVPASPVSTLLSPYAPSPLEGTPSTPVAVLHPTPSPKPTPTPDFVTTPTKPPMNGGSPAKIDKFFGPGPSPSSSSSSSSSKRPDDDDDGDIVEAPERAPSKKESAPYKASAELESLTKDIFALAATVMHSFIAAEARLKNTPAKIAERQGENRAGFQVLENMVSNSLNENTFSLQLARPLAIDLAWYLPSIPISQHRVEKESPHESWGATLQALLQVKKTPSRLAELTLNGYLGKDINTIIIEYAEDRGALFRRNLILFDPAPLILSKLPSWLPSKSVSLVTRDNVIEFGKQYLAQAAIAIGNQRLNDKDREKISHLVGALYEPAWEMVFGSDHFMNLIKTIFVFRAKQIHHKTVNAQDQSPQNILNVTKPEIAGGLQDLVQATQSPDSELRKQRLIHSIQPYQRKFDELLDKLTKLDQPITVSDLDALASLRIRVPSLIEGLALLKHKLKSKKDLSVQDLPQIRRQYSKNKEIVDLVDKIDFHHRYSSVYEDLQELQDALRLQEGWLKRASYAKDVFAQVYNHFKQGRAYTHQELANLGKILEELKIVSTNYSQDRIGNRIIQIASQLEREMGYLVQLNPLLIAIHNNIGNLQQHKRLEQMADKLADEVAHNIVQQHEENPRVLLFSNGILQICNTLRAESELLSQWRKEPYKILVEKGRKILSGESYIRDGIFFNHLKRIVINPQSPAKK